MLPASYGLLAYQEGLLLCEGVSSLQIPITQTPAQVMGRPCDFGRGLGGFTSFHSLDDNLKSLAHPQVFLLSACDGAVALSSSTPKAYIKSEQ